MSKVPIYIRIDKETLEWFRKQFPKGYQTRINAVLREYKQKNELRVHVLLGRAQEIFKRFHALCFWHLKKDLTIQVDHIPLVIEGLRKYGGREGFLLAAELDRNYVTGESGAD